MAKNVISYLNHHDAIWVDILYHKYGQVNFWTDTIPANCSWFFRGLWHNADIIKPQLWLHHFYPAATNIMFDSWYFEIPLAFKPTYLNMHVDYDHLNMSDLILDDGWNIPLMSSIFGEFLNFDYLHFNRVCNGANNKWVWFPKSKNHKLTSMVYTHFNNSVGNHDTWNGWGNLWRLSVAPRPKHFIWLLLHNGIKTYEYLYRLNLGAQTFCKFCNLDFENTEHLFNSCPKTQIVWQQVSNAIGKQIVFHEGFSTGNWLSPDHPEYDLNVQSIIGVTSWLIWKTRCNLIFRQESPDFQSIPYRRQLIMSGSSLNLQILIPASNSYLVIFPSMMGLIFLWLLRVIERLILMVSVFHLTNGYSRLCVWYS
ncbi:uncharacterized protein LOC120268480 [Dioscorea cayenensis subsp. rotundata]|uniref:Uncharacterized protein LOC120268480 n=1 Tax=Dioscorea cayennensis subsp. rotundata TaxID=55577 RepID=A0AB40BWH8_DIOCR|nr:uncharacterized protein LOC120268480 [Dioscorea cayenensis subsp. rotundata]